MVFNTFHCDGNIATLLENHRSKDLSKHYHLEAFDGLLAFEFSFCGLDHFDLSLSSIHFQIFVGLDH